jgi:hypothetical protein
MVHGSWFMVSWFMVLPDSPIAFSLKAFGNFTYYESI